MSFIKHNGKYYREIELKDLDKRELIELITNAVETNPTVIERWNSYPVYIDKFKPYYGGGLVYCNDTLLKDTTAFNSSLNSLDQPELLNLCQLSCEQ